MKTSDGFLNANVYSWILQTNCAGLCSPLIEVFPYYNELKYGSPQSFFDLTKRSLTVCTVLSAKPFACGLTGLTVVCLNFQLSEKAWYSFCHIF